MTRATSLIHLLVLANSVTMLQVNKEYDDPASLAYDELKEDHKRFMGKIMRSNFRPGAKTLIFKPFEKSCKRRCGETRNSTLFCHCDHLCALYRDCCIDYWDVCNIKTKPFNSSLQALWKCVDTKFKQPTDPSKQPPSIAYMMITRCPMTDKTTDHEPHNCVPPGIDNASFTEVIPVTGDDGKTYRNRHCAKCHGIEDDKNMTFWGLQVKCLGIVNINKTELNYDSEYLHRNCAWFYAPPNTTRAITSPCKYTTLCQQVIETPESKEFNDLINKCPSYMQLVASGSTVYKNFHCASCNGINHTQFQKPPGKTNMPTLTMFFDYSTISRPRDISGGTNSTNSTNSTADDDGVIRGYMTIAGLSLSIACLLLVVVTYVWFTKLRTVPGLVLLSLSISLLAYQALLLASPLATSHFKACKAVAILLHFLIISAFGWMTIMSYDVTKTFAMKGKSSGRSSSSSAFRRYLIVAFSIPIGIVALCFTLGETNSMSVGYGENQTCWITELLALILFFCVPVGIMLVFNTVALMWTIISIRKVTKLTKNVQKSVDSDTRGKNAKIYSKLSTVMGITWFLGFGVSHSVIVAYLYIIMNSLQGVFIFVTFVLNKRTIDLWRYHASTRGETNSTTRSTRKSKKTETLSSSASTIQLHTRNANSEPELSRLGQT